MSGSDGSGAAAAGSGVPVRSHVSVTRPSRATASYAFRWAARNCARRVARPTTRTSTPVAIGSSVPVWPIDRIRSARRARATTSWDVGPCGLSTTRTPST